jgi:allophanate hydrolase subunit 1
MTKVQIHFRLEKPLDDLLLQRLSDTTSLYGIQKVKLAPQMDSLMVEYDATRLRPKEVEAALSGQGIPVKPV